MFELAAGTLLALLLLPWKPGCCWLPGCWQLASCSKAGCRCLRYFFLHRLGASICRRWSAPAALKLTAAAVCIRDTASTYQGSLEYARWDSNPALDECGATRYASDAYQGLSGYLLRQLDIRPPGIEPGFGRVTRYQIHARCLSRAQQVPFSAA